MFDQIEKLPFKVHRAKANMTQEDVAKSLGINRNTYSSWEKYKTYPDVIQLIRLADVFECSLDAFYFPPKAS